MRLWSLQRVEAAYGVALMTVAMVVCALIAGYMAYLLVRE